MSAIHRAVDECLDEIDDYCSPDKMTKEEAKEFLEELRSKLRIRIEALADELRR